MSTLPHLIDGPRKDCVPYDEGHDDASAMVYVQPFPRSTEVKHPSPAHPTMQSGQKRIKKYQESGTQKTAYIYV
jgi:hypothetical protein